MDCIVVAVCNRTDRLHDALDNWLGSLHVSEIVVVDWGSTVPVELPANDKVILVRAEQEFWNLSKAYNLASKFVSGPILCKMDVDYRISSDFLNKGLCPGTFWRGDSNLARKDEPQDRFLNGFMRVYLDDFNRVKGYNEHLNGYGYDDCDIYDRLTNAGLKDIRVGGGDIIHIEHSYAMRGENLCDRRIGESSKANKVIAESGSWLEVGVQTSYNITKVGFNRYTADEYFTTSNDSISKS